MATITIELEPGEQIHVTATHMMTEWVFDDPPDPGEEKPEEEPEQKIRAIGGKKG
jgi:hypothetical protein